MDSPPFEHIDVPRLLALLFIEAKKKGRAWEANCPFGKHVDKHPSWSIREEPGTKRNGKHWCFSCHTGGTAIDLVMHVLGLSLGGANDFVAERSMRKVHHALNIRYEIGAPVIRRACKMNRSKIGCHRLKGMCARVASLMTKWTSGVSVTPLTASSVAGSSFLRATHPASS